MVSNIPWWALSPSPFSIAFYTILTILGAKRLQQRKTYKRKWLGSLTDSFFVVGFVVVSLDFFWVLFCGLRFLWFYPDSFLQIAFCLVRDATAMMFTGLFIVEHFKAGNISLNGRTSFWLGVNTIFLVTWFSLAQSPSWTDWTFAIRESLGVWQVLGSFVVSHVVGKTIVSMVWNSLWSYPVPVNTMSKVKP